MKKILIIAAVILAVICFSGCIKFKTVSYTDKTDINLDANSGESQKPVESEWVFRAGKIDYTSQNKNYRDSSKKSGNNSTTFSNVEQFYIYINRIKAESDKTMEFLEIPGYTKQEIQNALAKNREILNRVKHIEVPDDIFKTNDGKYFARNFVADNLETILNFRIDLLQKKSKAIFKNSKSLQWNIEKLEGTIIPSKESAFNYTGQSMMEEEGYVLNESTNKFELKNQR